MVRGIAQIMIPVQDLARARKFYEETLGLRHLFSSGGMEFFSLSPEPVRLMLARPEGTNQTSATIVYFKVDDIEEAHVTLLEKRVEILQKPAVAAHRERTELWLCFFRDSEGNTMAFSEERQLYI